MIEGGLEWYPSLDTDKDKEIRAKFCGTRASSTLAKVDDVTSKDESSTVNYVAHAMFDGAEARRELISR